MRLAEVFWDPKGNLHHSICPTFFQTTLLTAVTNVEENLVGRFVVFEYDALPYPGIVLNEVDDKLEVKVMNKVGANRIFWPLMDDVLWYKKEKIVTDLEKDPKSVKKRYYMLDNNIRKEITQKLQLDDRGHTP